MAISRREVWAAGLISVAAGFVLAGYSAVRNASSTLFKESYGTGALPLLLAVMPLGVLGVLYVYAWLLSALGPRRTLFVTTLGSGLLIAGLFAAIRFEYAVPQLRVARVLVRIFSDAYIALLIEQYWSFLNSTLDTPAGKRLNGPIMGVASLGAVAGAWWVGEIVGRWGTVNVLLIGALSLLPAAIVSDFAYAQVGEPAPSEREPRRHGGLAWRLFASNRLLVGILAMVVATQVLASVLDLNFQTVLQNAIPARDAQTRWAVRFEALMNLLAAVMQFVAAPLLLRFVPVAILLVGMPLIQMAVAGASFARPGLNAAAGAYLVFKMFDYSLFKAAKEILYIPLSYDARYRAKEVIDVFGYRTSKGATGAMIAVFERFVGAAAVAGAYGVIALSACAAWLGAAAFIGARPIPVRIHPGAASSPQPGA